MVKKACGSSPKRKKNGKYEFERKNTTVEESPGPIMKQIKIFELIVNIQWNATKKKKGQALDLDI